MCNFLDAVCVLIGEAVKQQMVLILSAVFDFLNKKKRRKAYEKI